MPELPEMENYKLLLQQKIGGKMVTNVEVNREKSINIFPEVFIREIQGQRIVNVERRAKQLLFHLEHGAVLLLHLMLGGWMFFGKEEDKPKRTIQIQLSFDYEQLFFIGLRLGYLHFYPSRDEVNKELSDLGPEPLDSSLTIGAFLSLLEPRRGRLKTKLVDQKFISGIGNCYSDEICFHAGILPKREIEDLNFTERNQLYQSMKVVLLDATKHGGYIETPFFKEDTLTGTYNNLCLVYDRGGEPCLRCGAKIIRDTISSRKTFYCLNCQK
ncbi:Fpg/Nei family DNA glycosylase [Pseudoneobacillus sp. C159]